MKNKKMIMIIRILLMMVIMASFANIVLAAEGGVINPGEWSGTTTNTNDIKNIVGRIIGFIQLIGSALSVIMIIVLGIKYMIGSAEEKAEYKKTMIPYVVGAVCIFAGSNIAAAVYSAVTGTAQS